MIWVELARFSGPRMRDQHPTDAQTARLINLRQVVRQTCGDFALVGSRLTTSAALRAMAATSAGVPRARKAPITEPTCAAGVGIYYTVNSTSIFMRGSASPATIMVEAGLISPR